MADLTEEDVLENIRQKRYYMPGEKSPEDIYRRVVENVMYSPDSTVYEKNAYIAMMESGVFLPNSPTLANAGTNRGTLSACFVLPIEDSLEGINKACSDMSIVHKSFGGTGFNFSHIRPKNSLISSTGGNACGPVKVLQFLNAAASMVSQGGKRQGANMGILDVRHPDIREWISCKKELEINHFNLSVAVTNEFMNSSNSADVELFEDICSNAWERGCPGLIFSDAVNRGRPEGWKRIEATNPCGEQPLGNHECCNLGSINLAYFVDGEEFNYDNFASTVALAVRFLDNVIDKNNYPLPEIEHATKRTRNIGLGVMGWADTLIKMSISYQSEEAIKLIDDIGAALRLAAIHESQILAEELGPYPLWNSTITSKPQRNYALTCVAPTGTLSKFARCSPGIEPVYAWDMEIFTEQGTYKYKYPYMDLVKKYGLEKDTAMSIPVEWHIKHQAQWQRWVDAGISKTVNLPSSASVSDVANAFRLAYDKSCKGITIYRDASKSEQVLRATEAAPNHPSIERYPAHVYKMNSGCGFVWVIIAERDDALSALEHTFVLTDGGCAANNESTGRGISEMMQNNIPVDRIVRYLRKVKCINAMKNPSSNGNSCSDVIGKCIQMEYDDFVKGTPKMEPPKIAAKDNRCPICGSEIAHAGGCSSGSCPVCGWSGCA
jgi:ribonucleoside-diphosphate reductase alpha chain